MPERAGSQELPRSCPLGKCDGSGWIVDDDDLARPCDCRERRVAQARTRGRAHACCRPSTRASSFDRPPVSDMARDPLARDVVEIVRAYIDDLDANARRRSRALVRGRRRHREDDAGDAGLQAGDRVRLLGRDLLAAAASGADPPHLRRRVGELSYLGFFDRLTSVDLLHIDDLGAEKRTDWVLEQLYAIVDERYAANRSMVVTTNLDHEQLEEQIGERTVSRLAEMCEHAAAARRGSPLRGLIRPPPPVIITARCRAS